MDPEGEMNEGQQADSSDFSLSEEEIEPRVKDQFLLLANTLKETNENILTFQFMLTQYRKLARIEPFMKTTEQHLEQSQLQHKIEIAKDEKILDQLKLLTEAVNKIQPPSPSLDQSQNLLAKELLEHQEKSAFRNGQLDLVCKQLDEKSKLCDCLAESNQRLTLKLNEEREKNTELDKKLENEKRAAAKIGKDITTYVNRMNDLESKLRNSSPKLSEVENQLSESSKICKQQEEELNELRKAVQIEKASKEELLRECELHRNRCNKLESDIFEANEKIQFLEKSVKFRLDSSTNSSSFDFGPTASGDLCASCMVDNKIETTSSKVEQLSLGIHASAEITIKRLIDQNEALTYRTKELETKLKKEKESGNSSDEKIVQKDDQTRLLENTGKDLQNCSFLRDVEESADVKRNEVAYKKELRERRKFEKELKTLQIKYAELLAAKDTLEGDLSHFKILLGEKDTLLEDSESKLLHLKSKSKILLRQYRAKRQSYHEQNNKLENIRGCLVELRDLCRTKDENYRDILDHLGSQIQISARLIAAYVDAPYSREILCLSGNTKLTSWFAAVQAISAWTHKQLMSFGKKLWSENGFSQLREMFMDADTLSEISHTLEQDSERERSVQSLIDAQERISRTQKDSFSLLISKAKVSLP